MASARTILFAIVRELLEEFPNVDARLIVCGDNLGREREGFHALPVGTALSPCRTIMISDADVRVPPDFAANVAPSAWQDPAIGGSLSNCFYSPSQSPSTMAMQWEAVAINADFWTQVLQSRSLRPVDFALGAVMTIRHAHSSRRLWFASLADYLADDYQLGRKVAVERKTDRIREGGGGVL